MQTRREFDRRPAEVQRPEAQRSELQRESFGELIGDLANNSAALVRDEIELVKQEMREKLNSFRAGVMTIAFGGVVLLVATLALVAAAIIGLGHLVGYGWAALIVGAALALVGGITAMVGLGQLKRTSLKPEQTIETLQEDKEWLKELT
ncbi:MAG TPA: phage holin family protein [Blastocatellia bacterium]|nr:phage holin family protein [Blastocatellia bacterium]